MHAIQAFTLSHREATGLALFSIRHHLPERTVDPRLITPTLLLEPGKNVGVQTERHRLLDDLVVALPLRTQIGQEFLVAGRSPYLGYLPPFLHLFPFHDVCISKYVHLRKYNVSRETLCTYNRHNGKQRRQSISPAEARPTLRPMQVTTNPGSCSV